MCKDLSFLILELLARLLGHYDKLPELQQANEGKASSLFIRCKRNDSTIAVINWLITIYDLRMQFLPS